MPAVTELKEPLPATGNQTAYTLSTQGSNHGTPGPGGILVSPNSSQPVEAAKEPSYPRGRVYHRAAITFTSGWASALAGVSTADTSDPTSPVPVWIGQISQAASAGATTLHATPYGNFGTPPASSQNGYVGTGTGTNGYETITVTAQSGGSGSDYSLTVSATHFAHAVGDYVVLVASSGISTGGTSNSVPSGPVGGPGSSWIDWNIQHTPDGSHTSGATVNIMQWDDLLAAWIIFDTVTISNTSTTATLTANRRTASNGLWYYCQIVTFTGTAGSFKITASVQ